MHISDIHATVCTLRGNTIFAYPGCQCLDVYLVPVTIYSILLLAWCYLAYPFPRSISSPTTSHTIHVRLSLSRPPILRMPGHIELKLTRDRRCAERGKPGSWRNTDSRLIDQREYDVPRQERWGRHDTFKFNRDHFNLQRRVCMP